MKKTIKKIFIAMCLITMTAAAAACGNDNAASSSSSSAGSSGVQQTVLNERATEKDTEATESSTKATEKGTEKATEKKSGTGSGSSKSDKDKKSSSSKSDKKNNENKSNNNSSGNGGEITYYYTTTTTGGSTGSSGDNSSAPSQNSSSGSTGKSNGKSNNSSSSQADTHAGKTWHEAEYKVINHPAETEKVWVVDQPATTKEEPVYETHDVTICNVCGADITNAAYREQHLIAHIEAGEGGSYHNEWREIQVGTKTVKVPEKGHWEKRIVKPAWTEKKLVREAGWY